MLLSFTNFLLTCDLAIWQTVCANPVGGLNADIASSSASNVANEIQVHFNIFKEVALISKWGSHESDFINPALLRYPMESAPVLDLNRFYQSYDAARRRAFFFDYDGTLVPFQTPLEAHEHQGLVSWLTQLVADPKNEVWIVTARGSVDMEGLASRIPNLKIAANHGSLIRKDGRWVSLADLAHIDLSWKDHVRPILEKYNNLGQEKMNSWISIREAEASLLFTRPIANPTALAEADILLTKAEAELKTLVNAFDWPLEVSQGKGVLDVRIIGLNKGTVLNGVVNNQHDFVVAAGDEKSDEDMFRMLIAKSTSSVQSKNVFPISVGNVQKPVNCSHQLSSITNISRQPQSGAFQTETLYGRHSPG